MAIPAQQVIRVGQPNQSQNSDSLYEAFTKTQDNFTSLFAYASPFTNFVGEGEGLDIASNVATGTVKFTNTGVTALVAGAGITVSDATGVVVISASNVANANATGTVTSVGISSNTFTVAGSPVTDTGTINIDFPTVSQVTTTTSHVVLATVMVSGPSAWEFSIKGIDANTGEMSVEKLTVVASNGSSNYTRTNQVVVGSLLGVTDAQVYSTTLKIGVTPTKTGPIVWTVQYQQI